MRVLLDTNVLISGIRWPGPSSRIWEAVQTGIVRAVTSEPLIRELRDVLTRRTGPFRLSPPEYKLVERQIRRRCTVVRPEVTLSILADTADNRVLECAVTGKVDVIVTGDKELMDLGAYQGVKIKTPAAAWKEIAGMPQPVRRRGKRK